VTINWMTVFASTMKLVPYVVAGVEVIHANETTETKTQLAQDALSIATQAAAQVLSPDNNAIANAVSSAVNQAISAAQQVHAATQAALPAKS
jgi:hypothetical protein